MMMMFCGGGCGNERRIGRRSRRVTKIWYKDADDDNDVDEDHDVEEDTKKTKEIKH